MTKLITSGISFLTAVRAVVVAKLVILTLLWMSLFGAAQGLGEAKKPPLSKICHTYPNLMKLGTVIPYLKKIQRFKKYINHVTHPLSSADISTFSAEISKFC